MNEQSPAVQAAVALENRLTTMELTLKELLAITTALRDEVKAQNGRVGKNEQTLRDLKEDIRVRRELIEEPRWGEFRAVGTQVKALMADKESKEQEAEFAVKSDDKQQRWWQRFKLRFETVLAVVGIVGGAYALASQLIGG